MMQNAPECPFCGSRRVKAVTKWMGRGMYRRLGGYATCLNCRCRSPLVLFGMGIEFDIRNSTPSREAMELVERQVLDAFTFRKKDSTEDFRLEPS
jgi:hypothetical protein